IDHDLPPCTEDTASLPFHVVGKLLEATLSFKPHFKILIVDFIDEQNGHKPLCIITDMFFGWCKEIAQEYASTIQVNQLAYYLRVADGSDSISTVLQKVLPERTNADGILVNTIEELDKIGLEAKLEPAKEHGISAELCKNWLDTKSCISVLYVSFGSQNKIAVSQKMQLAMALDASGKNFIWIVRPPIGFDINSEFKANEWLPRGFEERVK
ncbi:hypothetical protein CISIN_1g040218mg, partial [Citrus sinensis]